MMKISCLLLCVVCLPASAQVDIKGAGGEISVSIDGKPFTTLYCGPDTAKPYLHPLRSASGKVVTRHYPMDDAPGETHDHPHHRGLWFSHGNVNGYDFWANEPSQHDGKNGKIVLEKMGRIAGGKNSGEIEAVFNWNDPSGKTLLTETRRMIFLGDPVRRTIDFDITLTAAEKVTFGDTKEGTFAIRLAAALEEPNKEALPSPKRTGLMVDSEGRRGEAQVWGHRASWVDYFGELEGEKLGIAILDHPNNPRHPTYWHSRSYGLFAANIFGWHDFLNNKSADGSLKLDAGQSIRFRYRVMIHSGNFESADIQGEYQKFSVQ